MSHSHTVHSCLRLLREQTDITQERLAKAVGTSRQTICAMEKGDYIPSLKLALLISKHFKKPVEDIFSLKKCPT
ncbi:MAG: helix-turn-helix transcriptional regulator [Patescibacteria group bacterium]